MTLPDVVGVGRAMDRLLLPWPPFVQISRLQSARFRGRFMRILVRL